MKKLFYMQNKERGFVGNSLLFWRKGGQGYTCNLANAEQFSELDAIKILRHSPTKYNAWPVDYMEAIAQRHVDMQTLNEAFEFRPEEARTVKESTK